MAESSKIEWTDATFNPWWGCTKVSPGCDHCYAERDAHRYARDMVLWGPGSTRRTFGIGHWNDPLRWARTMPAKLGRRPRVFCASMADVFDKDAPAGERERLWRLIDKTPELDWLLLTKRVGNAKSMMLPYFEHWLPQNVWLGISVVNQEEADRDIPKLLELQARTRWLSIEPMLGPVNIKPWVSMDAASVYQRFENGLRYKTQRVDWIIVGGESGPRSRMMRLEWARSVREQCAAAGVPFFFKQGSNTPEWPKFKDFATYPPELQVREFPRVA